MTFKPEPAYRGIYSRNLVTIAPLTLLVGVGFGYAGITCDRVPIWSEHYGDKDWPELAKFEEMARIYPDADWRCILHGPQRHHEYQRHDRDRWVLIDCGPGFA